MSRLPLACPSLGLYVAGMGGQGQTSAVRLEEVACLRGGRLLFEGLSLALGPSEAALVTGPNGAGKSSLLRIAAGLLPPAAGRVACAGGIALAAEAAGLDEGVTLERALGFWARLDGHHSSVLRHPGPVPESTVRQEPRPLAWLDGGPRNKSGVTDVVGSSMIGAAMNVMGIARLAQVPVRMLSTGQRKRAVLARTIASGAGVWLLDEPANGLDADALAALAQAMAAHRVGGGIVVAASHQPIGLDTPVEVRL